MKQIYIYHCHAVYDVDEPFELLHWDGIARLTFEIKSLAQYHALKRMILKDLNQRDMNKIIIDSLSFLGQDVEE